MSLDSFSQTLQTSLGALDDMIQLFSLAYQSCPWLTNLLWREKLLECNFNNTWDSFLSFFISGALSGFVIGKNSLIKGVASLLWFIQRYRVDLFTDTIHHQYSHHSFHSTENMWTLLEHYAEFALLAQLDVQPRACQSPSNCFTTLRFSSDYHRIVEHVSC